MEIFLTISAMSSMFFICLNKSRFSQQVSEELKREQDNKNYRLVETINENYLELFKELRISTIENIVDWVIATNIENWKTHFAIN